MSLLGWLVKQFASQKASRKLRRRRRPSAGTSVASVQVLEPRVLLSAPSVSNLAFDGDPAQGVYGGVAGNVTGSVDYDPSTMTGATIEIDQNNDGSADYSGSSNGTNFSIGAQLSFGQNQIRVRASGVEVIYDPALDYSTYEWVVGDWQTLNVTLDPPANDPPSVTNLAYIQGTPSQYYSAGVLSGDIDDASPSSTYGVEIDTNGDGSPEQTVPLGGTSFAHDLPLDYGSHTLQVRAVEFDPMTGNTLTGDWTSISVDVMAPENQPPVFVESQDGGPSLELIDADPESSSGSGPLGQLLATDVEGNTLSYSGAASNYVAVTSDGYVYLVDEEGLSAYCDANGFYTLQVRVTDGVNVVTSSIVLSKQGLIPVTYMYVSDMSGTEYHPSSATEMIAVLENIRRNGTEVATLVIKGHAGSDAIQMGSDDWLTSPDGTVYMGDQDVTQLLADVTSVQSKIYLRGCHSATLAHSVAMSLDGVRVWGARRYVINIPGTPWGAYFWKSYSNVP